MDDRLIPFGPGARLFVLGYLVSLIVIGLVAYRARRHDTLHDFYLAGGKIGFVVLLLTLYSTQYSGNTLFGFSGNAYRIGFSWAICIHFMTAIVVVYLLFAPQLYALAKRHAFVTPADFLSYRFGDTHLSLIATVVMVAAIANYLLAQLMAMGRAMEGLTNTDPQVAYTTGVLVLAAIIVVYETLGGFRAVAWTDAIQGTVLLSGFVLLLVMVRMELGSIGAATERLAATSPEKILPPNAERVREWVSYVVLVGFGGALYPQSIQRIYAARSSETLRRSLMVMAFLPLTTTLVVVLVGIYGAAYVPGLTHEQADTILTVICRQIQQGSLIGYWCVVVLFSAILAGIMSTADSVLLSISSMVTKDIYAVYAASRLHEAQLTRFGRRFSWTLMTLLALAAIALRETTLVELLDRKFDLLVQLAPAFILGIHWPRLDARATRRGLIAGVVAALAMAAAGYGKVSGIHAGLFALALNLAIAVGGSLRLPRGTNQRRAPSPSSRGGGE